ncbi:MAG: hypothetical protein ACYC65_10375 [Candidatus Limnocylindrales bacterium]
MSAPNRDQLDPAGGERRRLDRAPGDRFIAGAPAPAAPVPAVSGRAVALAVLVADIGALAFFVLGQLNLGPGLLAVAAFAGWATAVALVDLGGGAGMRPGLPRISLASGLAGGAILAAILLDWAWAAMQGGVLGPLDYVGARYGPAAVLDVGMAALLAGLRAR